MSSDRGASAAQGCRDCSKALPWGLDVAERQAMAGPILANSPHWFLYTSSTRPMALN